jgi:uncharacterized RDD family membrane protein YckC
VSHPYYPPTAPDGRPLADQGRRLVARMLDSVIAFVALYGGLMLIGLFLRVITLAIGADIGAVDSDTVGALFGIVFIGVLLGAVYVYEVEIPLRWNGQTPGKRIMKIAIAPLEPGVPLRRGQLTHRMLMTQLFNLLSQCLIGIIDWLWCTWDKPYRQCLHDKGPKTVVVRLSA